MDYEKQIEKIKDISKRILPYEVTILTGKNGSGKSLVRKLVGYYISEKLGLDVKNSCASSISLQQRTENRPEFGAFNSVMHDDPTNPTGYETLNKIDALLKSTETEQCFIIIDEPEIGMGEELIVSLVNKLNKMFEILPEKCLGVLIITHNRYIVQNLKGTFLNFEDMTREEWLQRKIIPTDIETFEKESNELFKAIQKRLNSKKR